MKNIINFLSMIFPFAITILLWRVSSPVLNPVGILALIPIFYYSFMRPRAWFLPFAVFATLLLDYNFGTLFFWTILFLIAYAGNFLQTTTRPFLDIENGQLAFASFVGAGLILLAIWSFTWGAFADMIWLFIVSNIGYFAFGKTANSLKP